MGGIEGGRGDLLQALSLPLLDRLEGAPHQARLHALDPVAPPVELGQVLDLPVPERVARPVSRRKFALQGGVALGIFAQGPHHGGLVFRRRITAVLEGVHFHALFSGLAARPGGALGIVPSGVQPPGRKASGLA